MNNFTERAARAIADESFRVAHLPPLIAEGQQVAEQLHATIEQAVHDSIDFALAEDDREEAATLADRSRRQFATTVAAVQALEAKLAERRADEKGARVEAERKAAIAERDELAERFRMIVPQAVAALTELFGLVEANAQRMAKAGVKSPDAEATARGLKTFFNGGPIDRFTQLKIPAWAGRGRAWPLQKPRRDVHAGYTEAMKKLATARDDEIEARWGEYRVHPVDDEGVSFKVRDTGGPRAERVETIYGEAWQGQMAHAEAQLLRSRGVTVESIEKEPAHG